VLQKQKPQELLLLLLHLLRLLQQQRSQMVGRAKQTRRAAGKPPPHLRQPHPPRGLIDWVWQRPQRHLCHREAAAAWK
jgi:hypothetical protein